MLKGVASTYSLDSYSCVGALTLALVAGLNCVIEMSFEVFCFIFALIATIILIFLVIWNVIAFDDLKTDYKNPIDLCQTLNPLVLPEYGLHAVLMLLFLIGGFWIVFLMNVPLLCYNIYRYANRRLISGVGIYDATEIMNTSELNKCQREGWVKLAFFLISFFVYLYRLLYALLS